MTNETPTNTPPTEWPDQAQDGSITPQPWGSKSNIIQGGKFDTTTAIANLAVTLVSVQKDVAQLKDGLAQVATKMADLATAHNNLVTFVNEKETK